MGHELRRHGPNKVYRQIQCPELLELCKLFKHSIDLHGSSIVFQTGEIGPEREQGLLCSIVTKVAISIHEEVKGQPYVRGKGGMDRLEDLGFKKGNGSVKKPGQTGACWLLELHDP